MKNSRYFLLSLLMIIGQQNIVVSQNNDNTEQSIVTCHQCGCQYSANSASCPECGHPTGCCDCDDEE